MGTTALVIVGFTMIWQWPGTDETRAPIYTAQEGPRCITERDELRRMEPGLTVDCFPEYGPRLAEEIKAPPRPHRYAYRHRRYHLASR